MTKRKIINLFSQLKKILLFIGVPLLFLLLICCQSNKGPDLALSYWQDLGLNLDDVLAFEYVKQEEGQLLGLNGFHLTIAVSEEASRNEIISTALNVMKIA